MHSAQKGGFAIGRWRQSTVPLMLDTAITYQVPDWLNYATWDVLRSMCDDVFRVRPRKLLGVTPSPEKLFRQKRSFPFRVNRHVSNTHMW